MHLPRPTYANVASTLALVLALGGGTAYATGLVTTNQIANGAVTNPKLASGAVSMDKIGPTASANLSRPRAWALFEAPAVGGNGHYTMVGAHNIVGVIDSGRGVCVQLAPSINASTAMPIVSVQGFNAYDPTNGAFGLGGGTHPIFAYWDNDRTNSLLAQLCTEANNSTVPNDVAVATGFYNYGPVGNTSTVVSQAAPESFTILVP